MKRTRTYKKALTALMGILMVFTLMVPVQVQASQPSGQEDVDYTVTYRPGKLATFKDEFVQECTDYAAKVGGSITQSDVTGSIKMVVPAGSDVSETLPLSDDMKLKKDYKGEYLVNPDYQIPEGIDDVQENIDYVVDYIAIVDLVEFSVRFLDKESGDDVAVTVTGQGNIGDKVTYPAKDIDGYKLLSSSSKKITLDDDADDNVITFYYESEKKVVVVTETITVAGTSTTIIEDGDAEDGDDADANANAQRPQVETNPAADGEGGDGTEDEAVQEEVILEDEDIPLANRILESMKDQGLLYAGIFTLSLAAILLLLAALRKQKKGNEEQ